ncbi:hypothetical protein CPC08DRAFT_382881 [Agrocybe pediades]|nr:hypothetical protein CPC08DRAFT_382881 [Agrocybe pediades]
MSCSHRSDSQSNVISLSQLDYSKPECPNKGGPCQICQEILAVEKDAADAISRLEDVLARHQKLKAQLNHTHSPIIRDLPVEILSMIFYSCFSEEMRLKDRKRRYEDWFVPLHVGAVCRTWRQVAWSTPELWTVIVLEKMSPASYACRQYAMLEDYILRSGTLPIHVFLYDYRFRATDIGMIAERCTCWEKSLELVAQCSDRWEGAYMTLSRSTFQYIVSNLKITPPTRRLTLASEESWDKVTDESEVFKLWPESHSGPHTSDT